MALSEADLKELADELERFPMLSGTGPLVAEEDQGTVYLLREGGRQPVAMMPLEVWDQILAWRITERL